MKERTNHPPIDAILAEIGQQMKLSDIERTEIVQLLDRVSKEIEGKNNRLKLTSDRWVNIGVHLAGLVRRVHLGESLPPLDESVVNEIDNEMMILSKHVLADIITNDNRGMERTEIFLLAVHFQAVKNEQRIEGSPLDNNEVGRRRCQ